MHASIHFQRVPQERPCRWEPNSRFDRVFAAGVRAAARALPTKNEPNGFGGLSQIKSS